MKKRVADIIFEELVKLGIADTFCVVGGGSMHLNNAMGLNPDISTIFNHHEQASAMAAEAYARLTGKMAAVVVTSGPGATNTLTGVMGAYQDSIPMIVFSGQVRHEISMDTTEAKLRYRGIQEFDIINSVGNMTKYAKMVTDPLSIKAEVHKAIKIAISGRRGPVFLDIPMNVQYAMVEESDLYPDDFEITLPSISKEEMAEIFTAIEQAERPVLLAGNGIVSSDNLETFRAFAKTLGIPVLAAGYAPDVLYRDYEQFYGMSGDGGTRAGNFILQNADVILSLGCPFSFKVTGFNQEAFAPKAKILMVDIDDNESKKPGVRVDRLFISDLHHFFAIAKELQRPIAIKETWLNYGQKLREKFDLFEATQDSKPEDLVGKYDFWKVFDEFEPEDNVIIQGNSTCIMGRLQNCTKKEKQRVILNANCGSMGVDLPFSIGACVATKSTVTCVSGEGCMMMNLQELQTLVHYKMPLKMVIFYNDGYNAIRQTSKNFFDGFEVGCSQASGISFPKFETLIPAFGIPYKKCNCNKELEECIQWLYAQEGIAFLEIIQKLDDPDIPTLKSRRDENGNMVSTAIHDMHPFLPEETVKELMF